MFVTFDIKPPQRIMEKPNGIFECQTVLPPIRLRLPRIPLEFEHYDISPPP